VIGLASQSTYWTSSKPATRESCAESNSSSGVCPETPLHTAAALTYDPDR